MKLLKAANANVGDRVKIEKGERVYEGLLMPRSELGDEHHIVVKLDSGYNLGVRASRGLKITKISKGKLQRMSIPKKKFTRDEDKPNITIIGTGGTVASRVDYRTGAVHPAFTAQELYSAVPELADIANIKTVAVCNVFSENMNPEIWVKIARAAARELNRSADGVVIAHGTDTMGFTAAALSFMLKGLGKPVVLVGSQRSSDRPSSDAALNLASAVKVATSDIAEVSVVMHGSIDDEFCLIHRGTKVRKCHTSRRDTFQSINDIPIGKVSNSEIELFRDDYNKRMDSKVKVDARLEKKVALVKSFPGAQSDVIKKLLSSGYKGIVLEGTGLGHVPESMFEGIGKATKKGVPVVMTSQCVWGRVNMKVYSTGRDLLKLGVIPVEDMLPETALVKLMWVLPRAKTIEKVYELMRKNLAGEITPRSRPDVFLKPAFSL